MIHQRKRFNYLHNQQRTMNSSTIGQAERKTVGNRPGSILCSSIKNHQYKGQMLQYKCSSRNSSVTRSIQPLREINYNLPNVPLVNSQVKQSSYSKKQGIFTGTKQRACLEQAGFEENVQTQKQPTDKHELAHQAQLTIQLQSQICKLQQQNGIIIQSTQQKLLQMQKHLQKVQYILKQKQQAMQQLRKQNQKIGRQSQIIKSQNQCIVRQNQKIGRQSQMTKSENQCIVRQNQKIGRQSQIIKSENQCIVRQNQKLTDQKQQLLRIIADKIKEVKKKHQQANQIQAINCQMIERIKQMEDKLIKMNNFNNSNQLYIFGMQRELKQLSQAEKSKEYQQVQTQIEPQLRTQTQTQTQTQIQLRTQAQTQTQLLPQRQQQESQPLHQKQSGTLSIQTQLQSRQIQQLIRLSEFAQDSTKVNYRHKYESLFKKALEMQDEVYQLKQQLFENQSQTKTLQQQFNTYKIINQIQKINKKIDSQTQMKQRK